MSEKLKQNRQDEGTVNVDLKRGYAGNFRSWNLGKHRAK